MTIVRATSRRSQEDLRGPVPRGWDPHMRLMLLRHLRVAVGSYDWALNTVKVAGAERREIAEARAEAQEMITLLEGV